MNRHVPNLVIVVEVVDVMPPCREVMVALPHIKHLAGEYGKVGIYGKLGLKTVVGGLPEVAPGIRDVSRDVEQFGLIVVHRDIQHSIAITIANDKLIF